MGRKGGQPKPLSHVLDKLMDPMELEYFLNGTRFKWMAGLSRTQLASGTTGNEGSAYDFKSWCRNVMKQSRETLLNVLPKL